MTAEAEQAKGMGRGRLGECSHCGQAFMKEYNNSYCPDCALEVSALSTLSSLGSEDLVSHFRQDVGLRLQRMAWGHFSG